MAEETPNLRVVDPNGQEFQCGSMTEVVNLLAHGYKMAEGGGEAPIPEQPSSSYSTLGGDE